MHNTFFTLAQGKKLVSPILLNFQEQKKYKPNLTKEQFDALDQTVVAYFDNHEGIEIPDILQYPCFMVSNSIKNLFLLYDETIDFKAVQAFPKDVVTKDVSEVLKSIEEKQDVPMPLYWIPCFFEADCLHEESTWHDNGMLKKLVLKKEEVEGRHVFKIKGILENRIVISLSAAESLLRRDLIGIGLEQAEVV